jgi:hypothetical protein
MTLKFQNQHLLNVLDAHLIRQQFENRVFSDIVAFTMPVAIVYVATIVVLLLNR